jgi:exo-beta-1,3-glucanase (GH17 family)
VDTVTVFPTPGTYTIPGTTVTVSSSTIVPEPTTTSLPSGTHTIGGVTTVVETSTTIVCPFATQSPSGSTFTDVIETTTYICPTPGTYTIAPITTSVSSSTVVVYPTPATVTPGTYTKPEQTVTVAVTSYTYVCPFATSSTSSVVPAAPTTTASPAPVSTSVAVSSASSSSSSAPAASSTSTSGHSLGQVSPYAVTYTGYTHDTGACMTADEVKTELENIQVNEFYALRMYSTDCNQMETVATQALGMGLKLILGVYISSAGVSSGSSQVSDIVNWGQANNWEGVEFILLDNEAVSDGYCSASDLASFVTSAKETIQNAGYTGQFSIAEPLDIWQSDASTLCSVVDFASANLEPFFNSDVEASSAGSFVASEVEILKTLCPQSETVFVSEAGWPTQGDTNGKAVPGVSEQKAAMESIRSALGSITAQFSYKDDAWKSPGDFGVEQYWGVYDMLNESE